MRAAIFKELVAQPDMEWVFIDGCYARLTNTVQALPAATMRP
jgi:hypothetical protein